MIKIENIEITGWEAAIRGMRNPYDSWDKSDSKYDCKGCHRDCFCFNIGDNDLKLMKTLVRGGDCHAKFARFIICTMDITGPLYWWKQFDTYKVGTVSDSCSTMHTIMNRHLTLEDFSCEAMCMIAKAKFTEYIKYLNALRNDYEEAKENNIQFDALMAFNSMIQMLPESYNQRRTVQLNYQVLRHIYCDRRNHKLKEWLDFCNFVKTLPYAAELITMEGN